MAPRTLEQDGVTIHNLRVVIMVIRDIPQDAVSFPFRQNFLRECRGVINIGLRGDGERRPHAPETRSKDFCTPGKAFDFSVDACRHLHIHS